MPTAGKVLTILLVPFFIVWLVLASMATQRNRNHGEKIKQMDAQIENLVGTAEKPGEIAQLQDQVDRLTRQIEDQQLQTTRDATVLRARLSQLESLVALTREDLARVQIAVQETEKQVDNARQIAERRTKEKADTEKAIEDAKAELANLTDEDAELRKRRDDLDREFKALLAENKRLVRRILAATPSSN